MYAPDDEVVRQSIIDEIDDNIKSLSDYAFLASIGEEWWDMQLSPEYGIAKRLFDELQEMGLE
ncbi:hypothetical protein [Limosilactobacillus fermentum]|uniref:hypothetical protein n=1 Tax=Limosilactobacillus fermentum TaxID=1613 RepID=UPI0030EC6F42